MIVWGIIYYIIVLENAAPYGQHFLLTIVLFIGLWIGLMICQI